MNGYSMDMSKEKAPNIKKLLPQGWRLFEIVDCIPEKSKSGNDMFVFKLLDIKLDYIDTFYAIATEGKRWNLKSILSCCGVEPDNEGKYNWNFNDVMNKKVYGLVEHEPNNYFDRSGNEVKGTQHKISKFQKVDNSDAKETPINQDGVIKPEDIKWDE